MAGTALTPLDSELKIDWPIPIDAENREQISEKDDEPAPPSSIRRRQTLQAQEAKFCL